MTPDRQDRAAATRAQQRRDRERAAARATILAAAHDVSRCDGWQAVTMRRLADEIGYSATFAYRYVTGRDDIRFALVRDGFRRLHDAMATAHTTDTSGTARPNAPTAVRPTARVQR